MSWLKKLSQTKPMPLPFDTPDKYDEGQEAHGVDVLDYQMERETAEKEKKELSPNYFGSGQSGVAVLLKDGRIAKYTIERSEAFIAKHQMENDLPCLVKVFDVKQIQSGFHNVWRIIQERVKALSWSEKVMTDSLRDFGYDPHNYSDKREELWEIYKENPGQTRFLLAHDKFVECLKIHGIATEDAHMYNIGWAEDDRLVLFDLGGSNFS